MNPSRLSSAWLSRAAVAVAVFALPLFAVGTAQAAIAGGNPSTTTTHPDIRSAVALDASDVQVCFDKALSQSSAVLSTFDDLYLVGYNSYNNYLDPIGATLDNTKSNCVDLAFNTHSGSLDLGQFTAVDASSGAVTSGTQTNLEDSVTLSSSTTHNGTVGLSTGPDLVGPAPVPAGTTTPNDIAYVFDQSIDPASLSGTSSQFWYENATGGFCYSVGAALVNATTVVAQFPPANSAGSCNDTISSTPSVANARRAGVTANAVSDVSDSPIYNANQGTNMPTAANGGATSIASIVSAALGSNGASVTYTFDHPIDASTVTSSDFYVVLSNGDVINGDSTGASANGNSVTIPYSNLGGIDEYAVQAGVYRGAATATSTNTGSDGTNTYKNSPGAVPIGGNAGAFARGFTTGPDAYAVSINKTSNVATVFFDQRVSGTSDTDGDYINLLDAAGNNLGHPSHIIIPSFPNPGPVAITMDVDPAIMAQNPTQIQLDFYAFYTALGSQDDYSISQIVAQTGSGAHIKAIKVSHKAKKSHKAHKHHRATKRV